MTFTVLPWTGRLTAGLFAVCLAVSVASPASGAAEDAQVAGMISAEGFAGSFEYVGIAVQKRDVHVWGTSPVIDRKTGKIHLFVAEWDARAMPFDTGWWHISQIAHHVGDSPEGPFRFVDYVVKDQDGTFNSPINPEVRYLDGKYVLTFVVNEHDDKGKQHIVMYLAGSPDGPWRPAKGEADGTVLRAPTSPQYWSYKSVRGVTNPSLLKYKDKYHLYYKSVEPAGPDGKEKGPYRYGVAIADSLEGPYVHRKNPVTDMSVELEDGFFFTQADGRVYMLSRDYRGSFGSGGGGIIWVSEDGLFFPAKDVERAFESLRGYAGTDALRGGNDSLERPQILEINGRPAYMYLASRVNVSGEKGSCSYVFRIEPQDDLQRQNAVTAKDPAWTLESRKCMFRGEGELDWVARGSLTKHNDTWVFVYSHGYTHQHHPPQVMRIRFSNDEGRTWSQPDKLLDGTPVKGAPFKSRDPANELSEGIILTCPNNDLLIQGRENSNRRYHGMIQFRSRDGGRTWQDEGNILDEPGIRTCLGHTVVGDTIYLPLMSHEPPGISDPFTLELYKSTDNGKTWRHVSRIGETTDQANETGIEHLGGPTLITVHRTAGERNTLLRRSDDMGKTWGPFVDIGKEVGAVQQPRLRRFADEPNRLYLFGRDRIEEYDQRNSVWYSDDEGRTWTQIPLDEELFRDTGYGDALKRKDGTLCYMGYRGTDAKADMWQYLLRQR